MRRPLAPHRFTAALLGATVLLAACGDDADNTGDAGDAGEEAGPTTTPPPSNTDSSSGTEASTTPDTEPDLTGTTVTLITHDSFPARSDDSPINDALDAFTEETGIEVDTAQSGDAGTMVSKASLTAGNPDGDVMFGVDNTFLSRVLDDEVFEPYEAEQLDSLDAELLELTPRGEATPIDYGDVCVNYDVAWYADAGVEPPASLDDLTDEAYAEQLVVSNPATSSPGLAFLLATIHEYGADGWQDYWSDLRDNGVTVVDGWNEAYYEQFTWAGGGSRPLVVSYGTSPPAEVIYAETELDEAPTAVIESTCFRQIEYAGVLRGTDEPDAARRLVDFLVSEEFQSALPLTLFVYPANTEVELPAEFEEYAVAATDPASVDPDDVDEHRATWIDEWTDVVLR